MNTPIKFCSEAYFFRFEVLRLGTDGLKSFPKAGFLRPERSMYCSRVWIREPLISRRARYPNTSDCTCNNRVINFPFVSFVIFLIHDILFVYEIAIFISLISKFWIVFAITFDFYTQVIVFVTMFIDVLRVNAYYLIRFSVVIFMGVFTFMGF